MRILLAATSLMPSYGGPSVSVSQLALALAEAGTEIGLWTADCSAQRTTLLPQPLPKGLTLLSGAAADAFSRFSPDILHDNGLWMPHNHKLAGLSARRRLVSARGMLEPWARRHKKWKKDVAWLLYQRRDLSTASALHATSAKEAGNLKRLGLDVPVHTIPNGIDVPDLPAHDLDRRNVPWLTAVFLGRLYPVKGLPLLIEAWDRTRPKGWRLILAGPDEAGHKAELEALIANRGLGELISFAGPLGGQAKTQFLAGADLFVLPSYTESFGLAAAEALAHGVPVLTTTGTPWPMLRERGCGWTVDATIDGLVEGLREATSYDAEALAAMGIKGRAWMSSEFTWEGVAAQFLDAYRQILA